MKFQELRTVLLPEDRIIFRIYSSGDKVLDSGAVVLMNMGTTLNDAEVKLVYVAECIQHIDLKVSDEVFQNTDWSSVFGKQVYQEHTPDYPDAF